MSKPCAKKNVPMSGGPAATFVLALALALALELALGLALDLALALAQAGGAAETPAPPRPTHASCLSFASLAMDLWEICC